MVVAAMLVVTGAGPAGPEPSSVGDATGAEGIGDPYFRVWLRTTHRPAVSERNGFPEIMLDRRSGLAM